MSDQDSHGVEPKGHGGVSSSARRVHVTCIDAEGGITIPEEWMQELGWQVGDDLAFAADGDVIVITKAVPAGATGKE
jgi:bifunctional DNA-binding transcriptional regulator/antitoxin component of YhaV-PrlF toxin-antitoxin module